MWRCHYSTKGGAMIVNLSTSSLDDYRLFLKIKKLPRYRISGSTAWVPDEYAKMLGLSAPKCRTRQYQPIDGLFDYQKAITETAITKRRYAIFADCGLGKTLMMLEFARHAHRCSKGPILIVSPLMVIRQTLAECERWYGDQWIERVAAKDLQSFLDRGRGVAITNYDAIHDDIDGRRLRGLILDESSMLKSHYGKWGTKLIDMGRGVEWKLSLTGTPAPNDRIEYANQAVFLDAAKTVNEFLARYFVNKGQTQERWILKPHALHPFYRAISHWCIFLTNPATYGWQDNCASLPPIAVHIDDVPLTTEQDVAIRSETGMLFATNPGGIVGRSKLARIAKGKLNGKAIHSEKPSFIREMVRGWSSEEQTIIWCKYNDEQDVIADQFPGCANISGSTPFSDREQQIDEFIAGQRRVLVTKPKILGFGLNLHMVTRQVFSTCQDSYEEFYQAIKRSNRYGAKHQLNVHIPVTEVELPMVENVIRKAKMVQSDAEEQERIFVSCL